MQKKKKKKKKKKNKEEIAEALVMSPLNANNCAPLSILR